MKKDKSLDCAFLSMSLAYLEVGRVASSANSPMNNVSDYQNAVAYQLLHAIELFYKHMIKKAGANIHRTHDLKKLEEQYRPLYSKNIYILDHPFDFSSYEPCPLNPDERQLVEKHLKEFSPEKMSQHLRYPSDRGIGGYSFSLDESYFEQIKNRIIDITDITN